MIHKQHIVSQFPVHGNIRKRHSPIMIDSMKNNHRLVQISGCRYASTCQTRTIRSRYKYLFPPVFTFCRFYHRHIPGIIVNTKNHVPWSHHKFRIYKIPHIKPASQSYNQNSQGHGLKKLTHSIVPHICLFLDCIPYSEDFKQKRVRKLGLQSPAINSYANSKDFRF